MSEENLSLAHEVIGAVERRDLSRLIELTHPDVEWHSAFAVSDSEVGAYRGHEGMERYVKDMLDAWDLVRLDVDHEIAVGAIVLFVGRIQYRGQSSGIAGESRSGYMLKFKDGKVVTFRPFKDPERALEGVGLPV
jgi:ketosteroid isomerase-like protein